MFYGDKKPLECKIIVDILCISYLVAVFKKKKNVGNLETYKYVVMVAKLIAFMLRKIFVWNSLSNHHYYCIQGYLSS